MGKLYVLSPLFMLMFIAITGVISGSSASSAGATDTEPGTGNAAASSESREPHLRITSQLRNISVISGSRLQLKCKVEGYPNEDMSYTWYKDNNVLSQAVEQRATITKKSTQSKLKFDHVYSSDTGWYRCEASNGFRRVSTEAYVKVSFRLPPKHKPKIPQGKCETYAGAACRSQLGGKSIYVDPFLTQEQMETSISQALGQLTKTSQVSEQCMRYALPAFCSFVFPSCDHVTDGTTGKRKAVPRRLCREDCELMKYDVCREENINSKHDPFLREIFYTANCSDLPATQSTAAQCAKVGLPASVNRSHKCYNDSGTSYRGIGKVTQEGENCQQWPIEMIAQFPELAGGHNFCRNPDDSMSSPWCFVDAKRTKKSLCEVDKCRKPSSGSDMIMILVPSVSIPFVLACIGVAFCVCRKHRKPNGSGNKSSQMNNAKSAQELPLLATRKNKVPELSPNSIQIIMEVGDSQFGKVFKAKISPNPLFSTNFMVAVKTLREGSPQSQIQEFQREIDVFSQLQHENVSCLKAVVMQPMLRCMVFEYTNDVDLHEYLVIHSPQSDFAKPISSASSHASSNIEQTDFIRMAIQVASGMEYLASNNYVHRDLAARNVLVCSTMELKISNLGAVRDSYLSSYYRSPQGGQMLPIRWMAPESLQNWQFSNKSSVWSFGVLLWEMFAYGMQPYCGYSNHEVLDTITRRQLLTCPDQCPAKVYSLMHECWSAQPTQRPTFKDLRAKLQGWEGMNTSRVTSQLAQGIHRQLANVMRAEPNQYQQYPPQPSSIGGSTYSSSVPGPTPSPPPQYMGSMPLPNSPPSAMMSSQHPVAPNVSPTSQQFYSPPGNVSYPMQYPGPPPSNGYGESYPQPHHQLPGYPAHMQPRRTQGYRKGPASHSSGGGSSSCASSSRDQFGPVRPPRSYGQHPMDPDYLDSQSYEMHQQPHHAAYGGRNNRPLSGVIENDDRSDDVPEQYYQPSRHQDSEIQKMATGPTNAASLKVNSAPNPVASLPERDSSDMSTSSMRATSCDSGLPVDDVEAHSADPKTPLVGRNPLRFQTKAPQHGPSSRQFV